MIKLSYALTLADLRDGLPRGIARRRPAWRRIISLISWLVVLVGLLGWWFISSFLGNMTPNTQPIPPRSGIDDLWLVLIPTLMPVAVIACGYVTLLLKGAMTTEFSEPATVSKRISFLVRANSLIMFIAVFAGTWLLMHPDMAWEWTPTRPKIVVFAVGPWLALFTVLALLAPIKRRLAVRTLWNTTAPIRRPKALEIDQSGIMIMDVRYSSRYRWNHFVRYSETANLLRLHMEDHRTLLIPKRVIGPDEMLPLRALICENIPVGKFIISDPRFQVIVPQPVIPVSQE